MAQGSIENFSLLGGPFYRLGARLGLVRGGTNTIAFGAALGWISWFALGALAAAQGGAERLLSLSTVAIHARLLLAIPLLFVAEAAIDHKLREFVRLLVRSEVAGATALPRLEAEAARILRRKDSWAPDAASLLAALALSPFAAQAPLSGETDVLAPGHGLSGLPLAGAWYALVCLPLFRFLMFRWVWRIVEWWRFLWRLATMELDLMPAHPDGAGGLGYLETAHSRFVPLAVAISIIVAATFAEEIAAGQMTLSEIYPALAATLVVDGVLFLAPLCLFMFKLRDCREKGLRDYFTLAARYLHAFDRKWIDGASTSEPLLGTADLQSLADLGASVEVVRKMRMAPISIRLIATIGAGAVAPMLPLLLFDYPLVELAKMLFSKLAGL